MPVTLPSPFLGPSSPPTIPAETLSSERIRSLALEDIESLDVSQLTIAQTGELMERINDLAAQFAAEQKNIQEQHELEQLQRKQQQVQEEAEQAKAQQEADQQNVSSDAVDAAAGPSSDATITEPSLSSDAGATGGPAVLTSPSKPPFSPSDSGPLSPNQQPKRPSLLSQILAAPTIHEVDGEDDDDGDIVMAFTSKPASEPHEPPSILLPGDAESCDPLIESIYAANRRRTLAAKASSLAPADRSLAPPPVTENSNPSADNSATTGTEPIDPPPTIPNPQSHIDSVLATLANPSATLHPRLAYHVAQTKLHQVTERINITDAYWRQFAKWKRRLAKLEAEKYRKYGGGPDTLTPNASSSSLPGGAGGSDSGPSSGRPRGSSTGLGASGMGGNASSSALAAPVPTPAHLLGHGVLPGMSSARRVRGVTPLVDVFGRHAGDHRGAGDLLYARSEEDVARMIQQIEDSREERIHRLAAPIPDLLVDLPTRHERQAKLAQHYPAAEVAEALREEFGDVFYPDVHGATSIKDPVTYYSDLRVARGWLPCEEAKFLRAYLEYAKDFARIAAEVGTRTHAQCVQFYYLNKHRLQLKKEHKRFRRLRNAQGGTSVFEIATTAYAQQQQQQAAAAAAAAAANNMLPGTPFHSPAINSLPWNPATSGSGGAAGIGGPLPAGLLLKPTSSRWSLQETEAIKSAVVDVGKEDLASIAIRVKSKTMDQCKNWLHNHKDTVSKLIRDEERKRAKNPRRSGREGKSVSLDLDGDSYSDLQRQQQDGGDGDGSPGGGMDTSSQVDTGSGTGSGRGRGAGSAAKKKRKREIGALGLEEQDQPSAAAAAAAAVGRGGRRKSTKEKSNADSLDEGGDVPPPSRRQRVGSLSLSPPFQPVSAAFPQHATRAIHIPNIPSPPMQSNAKDNSSAASRGPLLQPIGPGPDISSPNNAHPRGSSYWRANEKDQFEALFAQFGNDWDRIAAAMGTKTAAQIQRFHQRRQRQARPNAAVPSSSASAARVLSKSPAPSGGDAGGDHSDASGDEGDDGAKTVDESAPTTPVMRARRASSVVPPIASVPLPTPDRVRQQQQQHQVKQSPRQAQGQAQTQQQGSRANPLLHVRSPSPMHARRRTASQPLPRPQGLPAFDGFAYPSAGNKYVASSLSNAATISSAHLSGVLPFPAPFPGSIPGQFLGLQHVAHLAQQQQQMQQQMQHQIQQQHLQQQQQQQDQPPASGQASATSGHTTSSAPATSQQQQQHMQAAMSAPGINPLTGLPPQYPGYQFPFPTFGYYYPPPAGAPAPPGSFPFRTTPYPSLQRPLYSPFHTQHPQMGITPGSSAMAYSALQQPQQAPMASSASSSAAPMPSSYATSSSGPNTLTFTTSAVPSLSSVPTSAASGPMSSVSVPLQRQPQAQAPSHPAPAASQSQSQPMVHHHHQRHMHHHAHMAAAVQHLPTAAAVAQVHAEYPTVTYPTAAGPARPDTPSTVSMPASSSSAIAPTSSSAGIPAPLMTTQPTLLPPPVAAVERPILPPILNNPAQSQQQQQQPNAPPPLLPPTAPSIPSGSPSEQRHTLPFSREHTVESGMEVTDQRPGSTHTQQQPQVLPPPPPPPQNMEPTTWASIASRAGSEHPGSRRGSISSRTGGPSPQGTPVPLPVHVGGSAGLSVQGPGAPSSSSSSYASRLSSPVGMMSSHSPFGGSAALSPPLMGSSATGQGGRFVRLASVDEQLRLPPIRVLEPPAAAPASTDQGSLTSAGPQYQHSPFSTAPPPPPAAHYPPATEQSHPPSSSSRAASLPPAPMSIQFTLPHPQQTHSHSGYTVSPFASSSVHGSSLPPSGSPPPFSSQAQAQHHHQQQQQQQAAPPQAPSSSSSTPMM